MSKVNDEVVRLAIIGSIMHNDNLKYSYYMNEAIMHGKYKLIPKAFYIIMRNILARLCMDEKEIATKDYYQFFVQKLIQFCKDVYVVEPTSLWMDEYVLYRQVAFIREELILQPLGTEQRKFMAAEYLYLRYTEEESVDSKIDEETKIMFNVEDRQLDNIRLYALSRVRSQNFYRHGKTDMGKILLRYLKSVDDKLIKRILNDMIETAGVEAVALFIMIYHGTCFSLPELKIGRIGENE